MVYSLVLVAALTTQAAVASPSPVVYQGFTMQQWKERLSDLSPLVRKHAVTALGFFGPDAVDALSVAALKDDNREVRTQAFQSLAGLGAAAAPAFAEGLRSSDAGSCATAANFVTVLRHSAIPVFVEAWKHQNDTGVALCAGGSDSFMSTVAVDLLVSTVRALGPDAATVASSDLVPTLTEALAHPSPVVRTGAANALAELKAYGAPALPALEKAKKDGEKAVREAAGRAIKVIRDKR